MEKENNNPLISVIVPIYNVEQYLRKCVGSILSQTYQNLEIILVDDGSPDGCPKICDEYAEKDSRVKAIHKQNGGLSQARNDGIKKATGEYLFFLDSDDWIHNTDVLEKLSIKLNEISSDVLINLIATCEDGSEKNQQSTYNFDESWNSLPPIVIMQKLLKIRGIFLGAQAFIIKRDFFLRNNLWFYPNIYYEDILWFPQVFMRAEKISLNNQEIFCYRINRDGSITSNITPKKIEDSLLIIDLLNNEAKTLPINDRDTIDYFCRCIIRQTIIRYSKVKKPKKHLLKEVKKKSKILKNGSFSDKILYCAIKVLGIQFVLNLIRLMHGFNFKNHKVENK